MISTNINLKPDNTQDLWALNNYHNIEIIIIIIISIIIVITSPHLWLFSLCYGWHYLVKVKDKFDPMLK